LKNTRRIVAPIIAALALAAPAASRAAEPYQISTILSLTGNIAFVGSTQMQALKALEAQVNASGGIQGRPLAFVFADDQSSAQTAVQLAQDLIGKRVPIILGSSSPNACGAMAPLLADDGPLLYCLANGGVTVPGSFEFFTSLSYESQLAVSVKYFRESGVHRLASIFTTDSGGQGAEKAMQTALALPENKSIELVEQQHFIPGAASTSAQVAVIKGAKPDAVIGWATGGSAGTLFRSMRDLDVDLPTVTSAGNLTNTFLKQYAALLPPHLLFPAVPYYANGVATDPKIQAAVADLTQALATSGSTADNISISAWDPALLLVTALRELSPGASAPKLRDYLVKLKGWVGTNGFYDFVAMPQRGLGDNNVVMVRWDGEHSNGVAVSAFGGAPLPKN
jgi:branched-chain amino acid transport system substrate-binding protein